MPDIKTAELSPAAALRLIADAIEPYPEIGLHDVNLTGNTANRSTLSKVMASISEVITPKATKTSRWWDVRLVGDCRARLFVLCPPEPEPGSDEWHREQDARAEQNGRVA